MRRCSKGIGFPGIRSRIDASPSGLDNPDMPARSLRALTLLFLALAMLLSPLGSVAAPARLLLADSGTTLSLDHFPPEERAAIQQTLALIDAGGPFPYRQDGTVFSNREGLLPTESHGYYHEYTVPTPDSPDRGARRLVTGAPGEAYYTDDHYRSFWRIR
jgi:ribonuclease T1